MKSLCVFLFFSSFSHSMYEEVARLEKRKREIQWAYMLHVHYIINNEFQHLYALDKYIKEEDEALKLADPSYHGIQTQRVAAAYFNNRTEINDAIIEFLTNDN